MDGGSQRVDRLSLSNPVALPDRDGEALNLTDRFDGLTAALFRDMDSRAHRAFEQHVRNHRREVRRDMEVLEELRESLSRLSGQALAAATESLEQENASLQEMARSLTRELVTQACNSAGRQPTLALEDELDVIAATPALRGLRWRHLSADENLPAIARIGELDLFERPRSRASRLHTVHRASGNRAVVALYCSHWHSLGVALDLYEMVRHGVSPLRVVLLQGLDPGRDEPCPSSLVLGTYIGLLMTRFRPDLEVEEIVGWRDPSLGVPAARLYPSRRQDWLDYPHAVFVDSTEDDGVMEEAFALCQDLERSGALSFSDFA